MADAYSQTPLHKKLGIKENFKLLLYNHPAHYWDLFEYLPENLEVLVDKEPGSVDFIHAFFISKIDLISTLPGYIPSLKRHGIMWVSWPKGSSEIESDLNRDWIREEILHIGLVDTKVASIDNTWSGLKFVYRLKDR